MPRDPAKLKLPELLDELRMKHGVESLEVEREPTGEDPSTSRTVALEDAPHDLLLERFGHVLDTTTEREREQATRELVKREADEAEAAAEAAREADADE